MPETESAETSPKILPGAVCRQLKTCGKANCRCARAGQKHVHDYRFYREAGRLRKRYVRVSDLESVRAACAAHKKLRAQLSASRAEYRGVPARAMLRSFGL